MDAVQPCPDTMATHGTPSFLPLMKAYTNNEDPATKATHSIRHPITPWTTIQAGSLLEHNQHLHRTLKLQKLACHRVLRQGVRSATLHCRKPSLTAQGHPGRMAVPRTSVLWLADILVLAAGLLLTHPSLGTWSPRSNHCAQDLCAISCRLPGTSCWLCVKEVGSHQQLQCYLGLDLELRDVADSPTVDSAHNHQANKAWPIRRAAMSKCPTLQDRLCGVVRIWLSRQGSLKNRLDVQFWRSSDLLEQPLQSCNCFTLLQSA